MATLELKGLTKHYGEVEANQEISFSVDEGEIFGYLGPNGAGKTTTIRTILGFLSPTKGTATILGTDIRDRDGMIEAKKKIGYLPANPSFDETSIGNEVLNLHASIKGDSRQDELLELFDPPLSRKVREYSTGNVQKLGLVQAFMHDPNLVVMDEPTSGLDPLMQKRFNEFIRQEKSRGTTVFLSSHVLSEVRRVCDRVGILREGQLVTTENVEEFLHRSGKFVRVRLAGEVSSHEFDIEGVHNLEITKIETERDMSHDVEAKQRQISEVTFTYTGNIDLLLNQLTGHTLLDLDIEEAPLEEVFMRFYGGDD